jgi:hypothetical protein
MCGWYRGGVGGAFDVDLKVVEAMECKIVWGRQFGYLKVNIECRGSIWAWNSNAHLEYAAGIQGVMLRLHSRWWACVIMHRGVLGTTCKIINK